MRYEGTIYRPPGEWKSYLLQCTIGCSHNACTFCGMYKDKQFRIRPMDEILEDISIAKAQYGDLERVFLCDGDAIAMETEDLLQILDTLYHTFPSLKKVTTYAGPKATLRKTPDELKALRKAGLARAYLGVESGWDELLRNVGKGVSASEMLDAGLALREAGFDLWAIILLGLAGAGEPSRTHIQETISMINQMQPRHLSAMTYTPVEGTKMEQDVREGKFRCLTPEEALVEMRQLIEGLRVDPLHITANHPSNYLPIKGSLPDDRENILSQLAGALSGEIDYRTQQTRYL
jgi:radical SAM superfamily enzyme YgiQ (UPF0313 family)